MLTLLMYNICTWGKKCFRCPAKDDIVTYELEDIITVIEPPVPTIQHHFGVNGSQPAGLQQKL